MAVVFSARFPVLEDADLPTDLKDKIGKDWHNTLRYKREKIITNLKAVIPDETAFKERIADVAYARIGAVFNPNYPKYKRIMRRFRAKINLGADDFIKNVDRAFEAGGAFDQGVYQNLDKFKENATITWRVMGDKDKIFGPVPKTILALKGMGRVLDKVKLAKDSVSGTPIAIFKPEHETRITSIVDQILMEGLNVIVLSKEAGLDYDTLISDYNAILDSYVKNTAFVRDNIDTANTFVHIAYDATNDWIVVDVQEATF